MQKNTYKLAGFNVDVDNFDKYIYIREEVGDKSTARFEYYKIKYELIEDIIENYEHYDLYNYIKSRSKPIETENDIETISSIRWYDFDAFFSNIFIKNKIMSFCFEKDGQYNIDDNSQENDIFKKEIFDLHKNELPFDIISIDKPMINGKQIETTTEIIKFENAFISNRQIIQKIIDTLIEKNIENRILFIRTISFMTLAHQNTSILRIRYFIDDSPLVLEKVDNPDR